MRVSFVRGRANLPARNDEGPRQNVSALGVDRQRSADLLVRCGQPVDASRHRAITVTQGKTGRNLGVTSLQTNQKSPHIPAAIIGRFGNRGRRTSVRDGIARGTRTRTSRPHQNVARIEQTDVELVAALQTGPLGNMARYSNTERITPFRQLAWHGLALTSLIHIGYHKLAEGALANQASVSVVLRCKGSGRNFPHLPGATHEHRSVHRTPFPGQQGLHHQ